MMNNLILTTPMNFCCNKCNSSIQTMLYIISANFLIHGYYVFDPNKRNQTLFKSIPTYVTSMIVCGKLRISFHSELFIGWTNKNWENEVTWHLRINIVVHQQVSECFLANQSNSFTEIIMIKIFKISKRCTGWNSNTVQRNVNVF